MDYSRAHLTEILKRKLKAQPDYEEARALAVANTEGPRWLIGGIVSRLLLEELYGTTQPAHDFDFLVEGIHNVLSVPNGWTVEHTKHGSPKFLRGTVQVDLFPIATHHHIVTHKLAPTIEKFFEGVPFTIQALAYDLQREELVGDLGIEALKRREYRVHNQEEAQRMAAQKSTTINAIILRKAESLGLMPVLVNEKSQ